MNFIIIKVENENSVLHVLTALPPGGRILHYGPYVHAFGNVYPSRLEQIASEIGLCSGSH